MQFSLSAARQDIDPCALREKHLNPVTSSLRSTRIVRIQIPRAIHLYHQAGIAPVDRLSSGIADMEIAGAIIELPG